MTHDRDGNVTSETRHHGGTYNGNPSSAADVTTKIYDGADRLVEVIQPQNTTTKDTTDVYNARWITRYLYDLSQSGSSQPLTPPSYMNGTQAVSAAGNLYKTQELLPAAGSSGAVPSWSGSALAATTFADMRT